MKVKVNGDRKWAVTGAGPVVELADGQIIEDEYPLEMRAQLVEAGYAEIVKKKQTRKAGKKA